MNASSIPPPTPSETRKEVEFSNKEYDTQAASSGTQSRRVGVYDRPERPLARSSSLFSTILLLVAVLVAVYFLFFTHHLPS
jgi:hypothetical protein